MPRAPRGGAYGSTSGDRRHLPSETAIPRIHTAVAATAVAASVLVGTAACGTADNPTAPQRLQQAIDNLGKERSLSVEVALNTGPSMLTASGASADTRGADLFATLLADTHISFSVRSRRPLEESTDQDLTGVAMKISNSDGVLVEYRVIGEHLYMRASAQALQRITRRGVPGADELPGNTASLRDVLNDEWVWTQVTTRATRASRPREVVKTLKGIVAREITLTDAGIRAGVDHITSTVPVRSVLSELVEVIRPDLAQSGTLPTDKDLQPTSDRHVTADFSISDGALTEVSVKQDSNLAMLLRFGKGNQVTAPARATELNLTALMQELSGGSQPVTSLGSHTVYLGSVGPSTRPACYLPSASAPR